MNPELIALFRDLADRPLPEREAYYEAHQTPAALRADVELLLQLDDQNAIDSFAGHVASAAIKALFPLPDADGEETPPPVVPAAAPIAVTESSFIGRYQVIRLLGRGGMAEVYLARDPVLDREVAVKLIAGPMDETTGRRRLIREARAAGRLQHANIVTIFDAGEHDGRPYIAMEYVAGETLRRLIQRRSPMPLRQRLELFEGACAGLAHAHRAGVVHLDIKPDNLMMDEVGTAKVLDFGIARVLKGEALATKHILGTLRYMSPEQIAGDVIDSRSDIFSLGCALFEFLSYVPAYSGSTKEIVYRIASGPVPSLAGTVPDIDPRIDALVARAMALEPDDRFRDLEEMRAEIARVRAGIAADVVPVTRPVGVVGSTATDRTAASALTPPLLTRAQSLTRLWRSPLTASIAAALVLATGAGSLIWGGANETAAPPATPPAADVALSGAPTADSARDAASMTAPVSASEDVWRRVGIGDRAGVLDLLARGDVNATLPYEVVDAVQRSTLQRRDTARASAAASASQPYRDGAEHLSRAERLRDARQPIQALTALWRADDLFIQALTAAGRPIMAEQTAQNEPRVPTAFVPAPIPFALPPPPSSAVEPPRPEPSAAPSAEIAAAPRTATAQPEAPPVAAVPTDREQILDVLNRYNAAYRQMDADGVVQVYPSLAGDSLAQVRRTFEQNRSYDVEMRDPVVQIEGNTARVSATLARRIVPRVGNPVAFDFGTEFHLRRDGTRWVITSVAAAKP